MRTLALAAMVSIGSAAVLSASPAAPGRPDDRAGVNRAHTGTRVHDAAGLREDVGETPVNDLCADAIDLGSAAPISFAFDNALATAGPDGAPLLDPVCDQYGDSPGILADLWWTWTSPADGIASFNTCGGGLDTKMAVYEGACPAGDGDEIGCSDDGDCRAGGTESRIDFPVANGTMYLIRVGAWGTDSGGQGPRGRGTVNVEFTAVAIGACCFGNGSCSIQSEPGCGLLGGTYAGDETTCEPNNCPPPPKCPGDCASGGDGTVDILDLLDLLAQWGGAGPCDVAPIGGDGVVDILDLLDLLGAWGPCA